MWSLNHAKKIKRWIAVEMKPIGKLPVGAIDQGYITELMLSIERTGHRRSAPTILSIISRTFGYALAHRYTRNNPAQGLPLCDILKPMPKVEHRAAIMKTLVLVSLFMISIKLTQTDIALLKLIPKLFL